MPTRLNVTQQYDAPASEVFALFSDQEFVEARLEDAGGLDARVVSLDVNDDGLKIVTRQSIPASALPSMVASMIPGDPATERVEEWTVNGDNMGYSAQFSVIVKGAPATLKGTMNLVGADDGSTLTIEGTAAVPIPLFGGKIEGVIVDQVTSLLKSEEAFTRTKLAG